MNKEDFKAKIMVHKDKMYRFALTYLKSTDDAMDVVQDVLVKLWETRNEMAEIKNTEAWCMTLVRNKALDSLKKASNKLNTSMEAVGEAKQFEAAGFTPFQQLSSRNTMELLMGLVEGLPEKQKATLMLRDVEGYSYLEIAEMLDTDMNQVKVNIYRARQSLRSKLEKMESYGYR